MGDNRKHNLNLALTKGISPLGDKECVLSISEYSFDPPTKNCAKLCTYLDNPSAADAYSLLHSTTTDCYSSHEAPRSASTVREPTDEDDRIKPSDQTTSALMDVNSDNDLVVDEMKNAEHYTRPSTKDSRHSSEDNGFCSGPEDSVSDVLDTHNVSVDLSLPGRMQVKGDAFNGEIYDVHKVSSDFEPADSLGLRDLDTLSTKALLDNSIESRVSSSSTVTCVPTHGLTLPLQTGLKGDHRWYLVVPLFRVKERLSRRQLLQIAAMMALGFVFVALILVWVFSPMLF